ncbi:hypothetical protein Ahy_A03g015809 [Arachis hypogaea]|uniref:Uncharacterized protein n=1 Tax=Arachis hypogaea TaxID=3818 RepID=A0A445E1J4_ARAHY|nr:hypothetical protein Ahy_A03g015809 [Arachis hypogaea]
MAVKAYNIRRTFWSIRYYRVTIEICCTVYLNIRIIYCRKQEKWEVMKYNEPRTCMQISIGQEHERLDSKVIVQHIFTMVKANLTINIRAL